MDRATWMNLVETFYCLVFETLPKEVLGDWGISPLEPHRGCNAFVSLVGPRPNHAEDDATQPWEVKIGNGLLKWAPN